MSATIIDSSYDMILGRQTIKKLHLVDKFPSHFKEIDNECVATHMMNKMITTI